MLGFVVKVLIEPCKEGTKIITISEGGKAKCLVTTHRYTDMMQAMISWNNKRQYIQDAFHFCSADEREFMLTGVLPEEWQAIFGDEDPETNPMNLFPGGNEFPDPSLN